MHQDSIDECFIWAFLLRSRRAAGYAIASVRCTMRASTHALRMPNAYTQRVCTRVSA
jgi:hypothetical protein